MSEALEAYRKAASRGIWLDIANSQIPSKERAIAISWRYQFIALENAKRGNHEQATRYAGFVANGRIRESTMAKIAQIKNRAKSIEKSRPTDDPKPNHRATDRQRLRQRPNPQPTQTRLLPETNSYYRQSA